MPDKDGTPQKLTPMGKVDPAVLKQPLVLHSDALDDLNLTVDTTDEIDAYTRTERALISKKAKEKAGISTTPPPRVLSPELPPPPPPAQKHEVAKVHDAEGEALQERLRDIAKKQDDWAAERVERMRRLLEEQDKELHPKQKMSVEITIGANKVEIDNELVREVRARDVLVKKLAEQDREDTQAESLAAQKEENRQKALAAREGRKQARLEKEEEVKRKEAVLKTEAQRMIDCRQLWDQQKHLIVKSNTLPDDLQKEIAEAK